MNQSKSLPQLIGTQAHPPGSPRKLHPHFPGPELLPAPLLKLCFQVEKVRQQRDSMNTWLISSFKAP